MTFCKVPSAGGLIQQLPTAHAGQWNIPKCPLPNLATERKKHSVLRVDGLKEMQKLRQNPKEACNTAPLDSISKIAMIGLAGVKSFELRLWVGLPSNKRDAPEP